MSRYLLSIGGAGHRSLKPLVFLAATGALDNADLRILCVDNDATNGNLVETLDLIDTYNAIRGPEPWLGDTPLFGPKLELIDRKPWSPFASEDAHPTLNSYFHYDVMKANARDLASLYEFLYDKSKRELSVNEGFRGRPSLGAAVYRAASNRSDSDDVLGRMRKRMVSETGAGQPVRLFAIGSIFGGTGAAGLPTIPSTLINGMEQGREHVLCGGAFLLPYFQFDSSSLDKQGPHANPEDFVLMMKDALDYYALNPSRYQCVYAIGADRWRHQPRSAVGKAEQLNPSDLTEFLAALAASNFYITWQPDEAGDGKGPALYVMHRAGENTFSWNDFPERDRIKPLLASFTRFSFLYLSEFYEALRRAEESRDIRRSAWYRNLIERAGVNLHDHQTQTRMNALARFCHKFLQWWTELHGNAGVAPELVDTTAFSGNQFHEDRFPSLIPGQKWNRTAKDAVVDIAKLPHHNMPNLSGFGHFVHALATVSR